MLKRIVIVLMTAVLLSCSGDGKNTGPENAEGTAEEQPERITKLPEKPVMGGTVVIGLIGMPETLNPVVSEGMAGALVSNFVHGYLFKLDDHMNLRPELATEVPTLENGGISEDHRTYTVKLKKNLVWHDGKPLTSKDVKFTYDFISLYKEDTAYLTKYVNVTSVETPDDHTVVYKLKSETAYFLNLFAIHPVLPKHLLLDADSRDLRRYGQKPVGAGPFTVESWERKQPIKLSAFDNYHAGRSYLDGVVFEFFMDEESRFLALEKGLISGYFDGSAESYEKQKGNPMMQILRTPSMVWEHIDFNTEDPILENLDVRKAVTMALDRRRILDEVYGGLGVMTNSDIPPFSPLYNEEMVIEGPNLEGAGKLLEKARWTDTDGDGIRDNGSRKLRLDLAVNEDERRIKAAEVIKDDLRKIGVDVNVMKYADNIFFADYYDGGVLEKRRFQMALYGWSLRADPNNLDIWSGDAKPPSGKNYTGFDNRQYSNLLREASKTLSEEKRISLYKQAQEIMAGQYPAVPLFFKERLDIFTVRLKGLKPTPVKWSIPWNCSEWWLIPDEIDRRLLIRRTGETGDESGKDEKESKADET